jgi:HEAT repeat protein
MKRARIVIVFVLVVVLGCLAFAVFHSREPRYQGKTLTEWIQSGEKADIQFSVTTGGQMNYEQFDPSWQETSHALKQMAPDAIPILLRWTQAKDSAVKKSIVRLSNKFGFFRLHFKRAIEYRSMAVFGFRLLGDDAKPAWPALTKLIADKDSGIRNWAVQCLAASVHDKETLVQILLRGVKNPDPGVQSTAKWWLYNLYPKDAEAAGIYKALPPFSSTIRIGSASNPPSGK